MNKVVALGKQDPSLRTIAVLEEMLVKAKKGEIVAAGVVAVTRGGVSITTLDADGPMNADLMLGASLRLTKRITDKWG